jgi:hypothetical protein
LQILPNQLNSGKIYWVAMSQKAGNRMLLNPGKSAKDVSIAHTYRNAFIDMRMHPG